VHVNVYVEELDNAPVDCVPLTALFPLHAPAAVQLLAFVADQESVELPPVVMEDGDAVKVNEGATVESMFAAVKLVQPNSELAAGLPSE